MVINIGTPKTKLLQKRESMQKNNNQAEEIEYVLL